MIHMCESASQTLTLNSVNSSSRLLVSNVRSESFTASVFCEGFSAIARVCTYTDAHGLPNFLERLSRFDKAWSQTEHWENIEGNFQLFADCSSLGSVRFGLKLRPDNSQEWSATVYFDTEFGQLRQIALDARKVFGPSPY